MGIVYVGCRTTKDRGARGKGLRVYEVDENGKWKLIQTVENQINPSFQCLDRKGEYLYSVHGDFSEVSAFKVQPQTGCLEWINTVTTGGMNPVHLTLDYTEKWLFVANLKTGSIGIIERREDGSLGVLRKLVNFAGKERTGVSHPHQVQKDRTGKFLCVSCQGLKDGIGGVHVFRIDSEQGDLIKTCEIKARAIAEPRHVVFHPSNRFCYGVNEIDYTVEAYGFDDQTGILSPLQILPTLPDTYTGEGWASGIAVTPDGKFLYVSNRKHDSVTGFRIDAQSGLLTYLNCWPTDGQQPRFIGINSKGTRLIAANELTDTMKIFRIDPESGSLEMEQIIETESPVCVIEGR